ncbi:hypothetical protein GOP47_0016929 [Adiantum capillus-veneris]|uniref:Uncharacterized protein n=1 Tax=Adiantum capillus-veneris TaxID=13818 RepID=A0A9D4UIM1_ADICA|nr:hypothetical protein GOP47_0016929 [Adiantum capillus-veneris]
MSCYLAPDLTLWDIDHHHVNTNSEPSYNLFIKEKLQGPQPKVVGAYGKLLVVLVCFVISLVSSDPSTSALPLEGDVGVDATS